MSALGKPFIVTSPAIGVLSGNGVSIFDGWAPHAAARAHRKGLHETHNLASRYRRQIAGQEGRPIGATRDSLFRNWQISMARIPLYRAAIAKAEGRS